MPLDGVKLDPTEEQPGDATPARMKQELLRQTNDRLIVPKKEYVKPHASAPASYIKSRVVNPPGNRSPDVIVNVTFVVDVGGHPGQDTGPLELLDMEELLLDELEQHGASQGIVIVAISSSLEPESSCKSTIHRYMKHL